MSGVDECLDNQDRSHRKQGRRQRSSTWERRPVAGTWGHFSPCLVKGKNPSQVGYHIPQPRSTTQELCDYGQDISYARDSLKKKAERNNQLA